ncbi:MAG: FAD-dependent monooxygenase [Acidimicrobiales bacterium]
MVGAGPVGLSAALALRAEGFPVVVLETQAESRARPGSRAIFMHRESLVRLDGACPGLGRAVATKGLVWSTKRTFWAGRQVYERTYPPPDPARLPHATNLSQVMIEELLLDACRAAGVDLRWKSEVVTLISGEGGVRLGTSDGAAWEADFVVAADGSHSAVRRVLGIAMEGDRSERTFVIVDVAEDPDAPRPVERIFHYRHPALGGRNLLLVPFAGHWRVDLQCHREDDADEFASRDGTRRWLGAVLPAGYADRITWVSSYRFLQAVAGTFADTTRRVLLVGEAAHVFAPFGARGLNSGIADAVAAARAIRLATSAGNDDRTRAVDEYATTRRAAAQYNRAAAGSALRHLEGATLPLRAAHGVAAALAGIGERAGAWLDAAPYGPRARSHRGSSGTY